MIEGCGKAGRLKEALWYYNEMKTNGFHLISLNLKTIINLLAKFNDENGAVRILSDMIDMGYEYASIIQILVQAYERADKLNKVSSILKASLHERGKLDETASAIQGPHGKGKIDFVASRKKIKCKRFGQEDGGKWISELNHTWSE